LNSNKGSYSHLSLLQFINSYSFGSCLTKPNFMTNNFKQTLFSGIGVITLVVALSYCSSDSDLQPLPKKIDVDEIMVDRIHLAIFNGKYETFIGSLSTEQKNTWKNYIAAEEAKNEAARTNVQATCNCGPGMATCSASGAFSECCICWNPKTQTGTCGVYWGVASCKNETNPPKTPQAKTSVTRELIKLYPIRLYKMLDGMTASGIKTNSIRKDLDTLVGYAETK
jgi:hypothetical protein